MGRSFKDEHPDNFDARRARKKLKKSRDSNFKNYIRNCDLDHASEDDFFDMEEHDERRTKQSEKR